MFGRHKRKLLHPSQQICRATAIRSFASVKQGSRTAYFYIISISRSRVSFVYSIKLSFHSAMITSIFISECSYFSYYLRKYSHNVRTILALNVWFNQYMNLEQGHFWSKEKNQVCCVIKNGRGEFPTEPCELWTI